MIKQKNFLFQNLTILAPKLLNFRKKFKKIRTGLNSTNTSNLETLFLNTCFDKNQLKNLIAWILESYGEKKTLDFLEKLKEVGFHEATQAGVSLGVEDLQIPSQKADLITQSLIETNSVNTKKFAGNLTGVEKSQQMIDIWNQLSESLREKAVQNFRSTNPVNPVLMMTFSGARGNISQVRQLVAMRGLMADPQGAIVEFPIQSNFREGLTITEYLISCYGARKGVVDTALRTATSGYLTRRLVDAVQHIVVTVADCQTSKGIFIHKNLESRLIGRVSAENISLEKTKVLKKNQLFSPKLAKIVADRYTKILVRSPLTCQAEKSICQLCYGEDLAHGILVNIGEAVGVIAAQSIGEPGTQLTMRTFHTGGVGVFSEQATKPIFSPFDGIVEFPEELVGHFVRTPHGNILYMVKYQETNRTRIILKIKPIENSKSLFVIQEHELPAGSLLVVRQNQHVKAGQLLAQASQIKTSKQELPESTHPIQSPSAGEIFFESMVILTQKKVIPKIKKQKKNDESFLPDIRTLGKLGSFWVFSSYNQRESYALQPFLRPGDLTSLESFLFHYKFKIFEKTQLKLLNSRLVLGQSVNNLDFQGIRFHKIGYSLNISTPLLNQTLFYVKNIKPYSKRQFLIWVPLFSRKRNESAKNFSLHTSCLNSSFSYLMSLKNYNLQQYLSFLLTEKANLSADSQTPKSVSKSARGQQGNENVSFSSRPQNLFTNFSLVTFRQNKFFHQNKNLQIKNIFTVQDNFLENEPTKAFSFFYNWRLFQTHSDFVNAKGFSLTRNFAIKKIFLVSKEFSQVSSSRIENLGQPTKKVQFLEKTLTTCKYKLFEKLQKSTQVIVSPKTTWVYAGSSKKIEAPSAFDPDRKISKFVFLEQGKTFDNFLFSNSHVNLKILPASFLKRYLSSPSSKSNAPKFSYSKSILIHTESQKSWKGFLKNSRLSQNTCYLQQNSSGFKSIGGVNFHFPQQNLSEEKSNFSKIEKFCHHILFYSRNKKFSFKEKTNFKVRISSFPVLKKAQTSSKVTKFVFIYKLKEQIFLNQNELKTQWSTVQSQTRSFDVQSPLVSKQHGTVFTPSKKLEVIFDSKTPSGSGWFFSQKNCQINLIFEAKTPFLHAKPNLKILHEQISCKPPGTFFTLFFYDFLSFQPKQEFQCKTFSNGWLLPKEPITEGFLKVKTTGEYRRFEKNQSISSILESSALRTLKVQSSKAKLVLGQILRWGQEISPNIASIDNGRIVSLKENSAILRLGIPFLASSRGILHVNHNDLIQTNDLLVTLKYRRLQTEDIVQGIPKIEQLFEARETQGGEILSNNLHILLQKYFVNAVKITSLDCAVAKSVSQIQRFLVDNILDAYLNQGVKISEKHVEIVVRQMTTKVRIVKGGYTGLVQGEIVQLVWIQEINKKLQDLDREQAIYEPIVLGISKSVLQSESFLLAASFQEVSRVLVRSALSRKTDFLRGLHENVILGQLIPAGTGLLLATRLQLPLANYSSPSLII